MISNPYNTSVKNYQSDIPLTDMTVSQAQDWGKTLINKTRGDKSLGLSEKYGSSAKGAYQMTNPFIENWGEKAFGKDIYNRKFDKDTQEGIMDYYLNHNLSKGNYNRILSDFQGLKNTGITPQQLGSLSSQQIRNAILATESGAGLPKDWAKQVPISKAPYVVNTNPNGTSVAEVQNKLDNTVAEKVIPVAPNGLAATYQEQQPSETVQIVNKVPTNPVGVSVSGTNLYNTIKDIQTPILQFAQTQVPDMLSGLAANSSTAGSSMDKYNKRLKF